MKYNILALMKLIAKDDLPNVLVCTVKLLVIYLVGNASGKGVDVA